MTLPYQQAHMPAMTPQEAAMLPAQTQDEGAASLSPVSVSGEARHGTGRPGRLMMPRRETDFIPVGTEIEVVPVQARQGSTAGRAVLRAAGISMPGVSGMSRGCSFPSSDCCSGCPCWSCPGLGCCCPCCCPCCMEEEEAQDCHCGCSHCPCCGCRI